MASAAVPDPYVALGDSYSSGNGTFSADLDVSCYRSSYAYPYPVSRQRPNTSLNFVACQGATTDDIINGQSASLSAPTKYVSITIGGNDVGFANLIINCTAGSSSACQSAIDSTNQKISQDLPAKLDKAYPAITSGAPNVAAVAVLGYPRPFGSDTSCPAAGGITPDEATQLNGVAEILDSVIQGRAGAAGFTFKASTPGFAGHDVCASDPYLNGQNPSAADEWHPTRDGHANGLTPLVRQVIG
jgi:lysophospholipase L1-like esterase